MKSTISLILLLTQSTTFASELKRNDLFSTSLKAPIGITKSAIPGLSDRRDNYQLSVQLGKLTVSEFNAYKTAFKTQNLDHQILKNYELQDFFPPFAQALLGKYVPSRTNLPLPRDTVLVEKARLQSAKDGAVFSSQVTTNANCHSLTWQMIQYFQDPHLQAAEAYVFNVNGTNLQTLIDPQASGSSMPQGLLEVPAVEMQVGDVLIIESAGGFHDTEETVVQHSATYVSHGMIVEKGNTDQKYPYRIIFLDDSLSIYRDRLRLPEVHFYRPSKNLIPSVSRNFEEFGSRPGYSLAYSSGAQLSSFLSLVIRIPLQKSEPSGRATLDVKLADQYGIK